MKQLIVHSILAAGLLSGIATADESHDRHSDGNIKHVNSSIHVGDRTHAGELQSVNGSISVGDDAQFLSAKTVNGSVRIGANSRAEWLKTVNGKIVVGQRSQISGDITAVNGRLVIEDDVFVQGNAKSTNGQITSTSGDITVNDNARVDGGIQIKDSDSWWSGFSSLFGGEQRVPVITIGPGAQVNGDLVFDRDVELRVHSTAKIGHVKGATVTTF